MQSFEESFVLLLVNIDDFIKETDNQKFFANSVNMVNALVSVSRFVNLFLYFFLNVDVDLLPSHSSFRLSRSTNRDWLILDFF